jgi:two-component system cell cycle response regulator DivK
MLKMRLELLSDFEVLTATDGEKGCEMALSDRPDIILMDLEMTVVNGWEATRRLKGNPQTRDIPVIVLSAHALAGEREKAIAAGYAVAKATGDACLSYRCRRSPAGSPMAA